MSLEKTVLIPGGPEALVYTTLSGTIGKSTITLKLVRLQIGS